MKTFFGLKFLSQMSLQISGVLVPKDTHQNPLKSQKKKPKKKPDKNKNDKPKKPHENNHNPPHNDNHPDTHKDHHRRTRILEPKKKKNSDRNQTKDH